MAEREGSAGASLSNLPPPDSTPAAARSRRSHPAAIEIGAGEKEREETGPAKKRERYGQPGEAAEFFRLKRQPAGDGDIPVENYLSAIEQVRHYPQYSTRTNSYLPPMDQVSRMVEQAASLDGWTPLGPGNIGGRTRAILINPDDPDTMYLAGAAGGVWKSIDGGKSWRPLTDLLPNLAVNTLAFDPLNPEIIYAGTGEGYFNSDAIRGAGIFRSFDGGVSWRRLDGTGSSDFHYVNDIVVSQVNRNRLYAATRAGVMRSLDGGTTWTRVLNSNNGGCLDLVMRRDQSTDYVFAACGTEVSSMATAAVQASIYRNIDASSGLSAWVEVYSEPGMGRTSLAIAGSNPNVIYAVSSESGAKGPAHSLHAVFRSIASGEPGSWTAQVRNTGSKSLNSTLFTNPIFAYYNECNRGNSQFYHQGWYNNVIAVDPKNENIVWVGGIDLFRSDDGGANWGMASYWHLAGKPQYAHADQHAIAFHPGFDGTGNTRMFIANDGGIYRTDDAREQTSAGERAPCAPENSRITWTSLNNNYSVTQFYHGAPFPGGGSYLGGTQDNGVILGSDVAGINGWREMLSGDGGYVAIAPDKPLVVYAENTGLSLRKSDDGGLTFRPATTGISNIGFNFISPFVMDPANSDRLWIGGRHLWRTGNGALTWWQASADLSGSATAIAVAPTNGNFVLAGTNTGFIHRTSVGLNTDGDTVWPGVKPRDGYVSSVTFDPVNRDIAYATYSTFGGKHVWRTLDGGLHWSPIDGVGATAVPDIPVNCIVVDQTNTQRLYIGTDIGVFVSLDDGQTWAVENTGFANAPVESLTLNYIGGAAYLFAFTHGRGVWRVPLDRVCSATLSSADLVINYEGGQGSVDMVSSIYDCQWTAESGADWIRIDSPTTWQGSGTLSFTVTPNPSTHPRTATMTVAGQTVKVTQAGLVVSVSAASLQGEILAPESIVSAFGAGLASSIQIASENQLPTELGGTVIVVRDSIGIERKAPIFFVSPNQVNYLMPEGTATGPALIKIINEKGEVFTGQVQIEMVAPALFSANASGQGGAVGLALRVKADGSQAYEHLSTWNPAQNRFVVRPIDLGPASDQIFLILYGTGMRFRSDPGHVKVSIGGIDAPVLYVGKQGDYIGLDQVNLIIPRSLAGSGEVDVMITIDDRPANVVRIGIK